MAALARRAADRTPARAEILLALQLNMMGIFQCNSSPPFECSNWRARIPIVGHSIRTFPLPPAPFSPPAPGIEPLDWMTRVQPRAIFDILQFDRRGSGRAALPPGGSQAVSSQLALGEAVFLGDLPVVRLHQGLEEGDFRHGVELGALLKGRGGGSPPRGEGERRGLVSPWTAARGSR